MDETVATLETQAVETACQPRDRMDEMSAHESSRHALATMRTPKGESSVSLEVDTPVVRSVSAAPAVAARDRIPTRTATGQPAALGSHSEQRTQAQASEGKV